MKKKCTYCNIEVVTYVEHETHPLFFLSSFLVFIVFGLLSAIIIPVLYLLTKNAVHRCSRCLQKLGEKQCFGIPTNLNDQVSFKDSHSCLSIRFGHSDSVNAQW